MVTTSFHFGAASAAPYARLAQLGRAPGLHPGGRRFEPCIAHHMRTVKKVKCEFCGKEISKSNYSKHLRSHENGNFDKKEQHRCLDHDDLFCKFCGKEYINKNSLLQHEIRCKLNPNRIDTSRSFNNGNRPAWNKGLSKETDERVLKGTITYKENHEKGLHKDMSGDNNVSKRPEVREKISNTMKEKRYPRWNIKRNKKSFAEQFFVIVLNNNNIDYINEYPVKNDQGFFYSLDFFIDIKGYKIDLEIDGQQHQDPQRKESDIRRDKFLQKNGYIVYRIDWNEINSQKGKLLMEQKIQDFLSFIDNLS